MGTMTKRRNRYIVWKIDNEWQIRFRSSPKDCTDWVGTCPTRSLARRLAGHLNDMDNIGVK